MELKRPTLVEEQIETLIKHGMIIDDVNLASEFLSDVGYYRLSGYLIQFRKDKNSSNFYKPINFYDFVKIYRFDEEIRNFLRKYIEIEEVYYKAIIANNFSLVKCNCPPYNQHYNLSNYYSKEAVEELINKFEKNKKRYHDSPILEHHIKEYNGQFPLWVIMEMISLSDASKFYSYLYYSEKKLIASAVNTSGYVLENHLHCISVLRNKCAHTARLYNTDFNPPVKLGYSFLKNNPTVKNNSLFAYVVVLNKRLPNEAYKYEFINGLVEIVEKYKAYIDYDLIGFPKNYEEILWKYK